MCLQQSFNPYRVFKFVATQRMAGLDRIWQTCFNPYRVFKFVATLLGKGATASYSSMFQSLSGFQVRCNVDYSITKEISQICFNPYRVFKFVATSCRVAGCPSAGSVSIPIGFSSSLQHITRAFTSVGFSCFNPYRVFKFVATPPSQFHSRQRVLFQSLSGFQVRCNLRRPPRSLQA